VPQISGVQRPWADAVPSKDVLINKSGDAMFTATYPPVSRASQHKNSRRIIIFPLFDMD